MSAPGVTLEVLASPSSYSQTQIDRAIHIAAKLRCTRLVLLEQPELRDR